MSQKRKIEEYHDPDYHKNSEKKPRVSPEEKNAKIVEIVKREFKTELEDREKEVLEIEARLEEANKQLEKLKYAAVAHFYKKGEISKVFREDNLEEETLKRDQISLHPAIKKLVGKTPKKYSELVTDRPARRAAKDAASLLKLVSKTKKDDKVVKDVPESAPVKDKEEDSKITRLNSSRGRNQEKHLIVVGNTSKYIGENKLNSLVSHKWLVYVQARSQQPLDKLVERIRFFLHPTYKPNDCVDVLKAPFEVSRFGWGEFTIRVQLHFHPELRQKPIQILHRVKLDERETGLETLGSETVAELWLNRMEGNEEIEEEMDNQRSPTKLKSMDPPNMLKVRQDLIEVVPQVDISAHVLDHCYSKNHNFGREALTELFNSIPFCTVREAVEFLLRRLPLVCPDSTRFPAMLSSFAFISPSEKSFRELHRASRCSKEWFRAKFINLLLRKHAKLRDLPMWSTKEIVIFARKHFYIPSICRESSKNLKAFLKEEIKWEKFSEDTTTTSAEISKWISENHSPIRKIPANEEEEIIDVEEISGRSEKSRMFCDSTKANKTVLWNLEEILGSNIRKKTEDVKDALQVALKIFLEDILRRSAANVMDDLPIQPMHVKSALASRKEFDFLTNHSLGKIL